MTTGALRANAQELQVSTTVEENARRTRAMRAQYDHAHFAYIVGTGLAAISPTWVVIYSLSGNDAKYNASLSSVRSRRR